MARHVLHADANGVSTAVWTLIGRVRAKGHDALRLVPLFRGNVVVWAVAHLCAALYRPSHGRHGW